MQTVKGSLGAIKKAFEDWEKLRQLTPLERSFLREVEEVCRPESGDAPIKKRTDQFLISKETISMKALECAVKICKKYGMYQRIHFDFKDAQEGMSLRIWNGLIRLPYSQGYVKLTDKQLQARGFF